MSQHIVQRQILHVELTGTEADGLALQRQLSEMCHSWLIPALEQALDQAQERLIAPDEHLYVERLEIDVGVLSVAQLGGDLAEAITRQVFDGLRTQVQVDDGSSTVTVPSRSTSRRTVQQSIDAALVHFLRHGHLPWAFKLPAGRTFDQEVLAAWQTHPYSLDGHGEAARAEDHPSPQHAGRFILVPF